MKHIPYGRHYIDNSDIKQVVETLRSDWVTQGRKIGEFEKRLASYCGARYAVVVSSGTAALHIAAIVAGIKPGTEVITSPITFVASANCVLYCGGQPVFADVQKDTINIDPEDIEKKITKRTKAIIPVHFSGHPCDLVEIYNIAKKYNLIVIEDAAHALGAIYKSSRIGSCKFSDMTVLSFHPVKHITTGEGGAVLINEKDIYERLLMLRNHGITKEVSMCERYDGPWYYEQKFLGFNYRITDFQCALGISQLKKLDGFVERRREIAYLYNKRLSNIEEIELPAERSRVRSSWHLYPIRLKEVKKREKLFSYLRNNNIGVQVHYIPVYMQPYYRNLGYKNVQCRTAEDYYHRTISLPVYPGLSEKKIDFVVAKIKKGMR